VSKQPPIVAFVYGDLMKQRWVHFYHLKRLDAVDSIAYRGDLRHYRRDLAALFDPASPWLVPGKLLAVPNEAVLRRLDLMERPQYRRVRLPGVWLDGHGWVEPWAYEFAGDSGLFARLPRVKEENA